MKETEGADGVADGVPTDDDDVQGEDDGADEDKEIAAVELGESLRRNGEEVEANQSGGGAGPDPTVDVASPEDGGQDGHENYAKTGNESGLRGRGVEKAGGLKGVAGEEQRADQRTGADFAAGELAGGASEDERHEHGGQRKAQGQKSEDGGVVEGVFDNDESRAPEDGGEYKRGVGSEAA